MAKDVILQLIVITFVSRLLSLLLEAFGKKEFGSLLQILAMFACVIIATNTCFQLIESIF